MAMQFLRRAQQLKILDAADETAAILRSPAFTRFRPALAQVGFDVDPFADALSEAAAAGRAAYTERASAQDHYAGEASDVRAVMTAFDAWLAKLHTAARAIELSDHPLASKILHVLKVESFEGGSDENTHGNAPSVIQNLERVGDLSRFGVTPAFVDEGRTLLAQMPKERFEAGSSGWGRQVFTSDLHVHLDTIVELMERYERFRELAIAMSEREIPGLGLAAVRANLAPRPSRSLADEDVVDLTSDPGASASSL